MLHSMLPISELSAIETNASVCGCSVTLLSALSGFAVSVAVVHDCNSVKSKLRNGMDECCSATSGSGWCTVTGYLAS